MVRTTEGAWAFGRMLSFFRVVRPNRMAPQDRLESALERSDNDLRKLQIALHLSVLEVHRSQWQPAPQGVCPTPKAFWMSSWFSIQTCASCLSVIQDVLFIFKPVQLTFASSNRIAVSSTEHTCAHSCAWTLCMRQGWACSTPPPQKISFYKCSQSYPLSPAFSRTLTTHSVAGLSRYPHLCFQTNLPNLMLKVTESEPVSVTHR